MPEVELIYAGQCPNVADTRAHLLRAFARAGLDPRWTEWQVGDADAPAHTRGHGSPTILVDRRDVAPQLESGAADTCRLYEQTDGGLGGVPSVEAITAALAQRSAAGGPLPNGTHCLRLNIAMLPGVGSAFLPKIACPACWPAYAGFMSSVGLGFLLDTTYLLPLTATFLAIAVGALAHRARQRRGYAPFVLGLVAASGVLVGKFAFESNFAMYAGLAALVAASLWNTWPKREHRGPCPSCAFERPEVNPQSHRREA